MAVSGTSKYPPVFEEEDIIWLVIVFLQAVFLFSLPYIVGALFTPPGEQFLGLLRISDDLLIYLSWMEQIRQGHLLFVNLYTSLKQRYPFISLFVLFMGGICRLFHIAPFKMLFISRYIFAFCLIFVIYNLLALVFPQDRKARKLALLVVVFSSGAGWLTGGYSPARGVENSIDLWQPEATVFFTLYVNPLHAFSLIFILCFFISLLKWKDWKGGILGGICLLVLANAHTYDLIIIGSVWTLYLVGLWIKNERAPLQDIRNTLLAWLIASPGIVYQLFIFLKDPVFSKRAIIPLPSTPSFYWYITGMGFLIPLSALAIIRRVKEKKVDDIFLFLSIWATTGFFLPYLPFPFQYKLFMGTQIPLAILSTMTLYSLFVQRKKMFLLFSLLPFLFLSNAVILGNRIYYVIANGPGNLSHWELDALNWLKEHSGQDDVILAYPDFATYIPAFCGRRVYAGHFVETPDFRRRCWEVLQFYLGKDLKQKKEFLKANDIKFIYYGRYERFFFPDFPAKARDFLHLAYQNKEVSIWTP